MVVEPNLWAAVLPETVFSDICAIFATGARLFSFCQVGEQAFNFSIPDNDSNVVAYLATV